jgi:ATP-dependent helicase/nuclease subunit B
VLDDDRLQAASEVVRARRSGDFTPFDGNVTAVAGPRLLDRRFSATRLQTWAACPHAYFGQYVLQVEPVEEPERRLNIDPADKGSLFHEVVDEYVKEVIAGGGGEDRLMAIFEKTCADYEARGLTGRGLLWRGEKERLRADLETFLRKDDERLADGVRPRRTEQRFSDLVVTLSSGRSIRVAGSIDRVDDAPDGSLVVLDYKTGSDRGYEKLSQAQPHLGGTRLQPYLYARAAVAELGTVLPVWTGFWFTSAKRDFKWKGYWMTPEVVAEVEAALEVIVDGIGRGVFPARPSQQPAWRWVDCWYCTPDGLSGAERRREWDAKRLDPVLRPYLELAEPEALDDDD